MGDTLVARSGTMNPVPRDVYAAATAFNMAFRFHKANVIGLVPVIQSATGPHTISLQIIDIPRRHMTVATCTTASSYDEVVGILAATKARLDNCKTYGEKLDESLQHV